MFISLDLETTGVVAEKDKIIEFGAIKFDMNGEKETLQILINPGITLTQIITHITGITDEDLKDAPLIDKKAEEIKNFIGDLPIVGHNIQFDTGFLRENNILTTNNPEYDTYLLSSILIPHLPSHSLEILSSVLDLKHREKHRALDDAIAAMELFLKLGKIFQSLPEELIKKIHSLCEKTNWPLKNFIKTLTPTNEKFQIPIQTPKNSSQPIAKTGKTETQITPAISPTTNENNENTETETTTPTTPLPQNYNKILSTEEKAIFEIPPPYQNLIKSLSKDMDKDSYLALPYKLFQKETIELPDTIAKIDSPQKYISLKQLEKFEQKASFENHEFSALLKYLIWSKQTKTGLLSELTLFNDEKSTIPQITIDENTEPPEQSHFFKKALTKDIDSPAICTHSYLIEKSQKNPKKIKDLIILDIEEFTKTLFHHHSAYTRLEIILGQLNSLKEFEPENKTIESLISKTTILFGLIGLFYENHNDKNPYSARAIVSTTTTELKEWKDIKSVVSNLFEISKELGEINNEKTYPYLQNWKTSLKSLHKIFVAPDTKENMIWIEKDYMENITAQSAPFSTKQEFQKILENTENYKIIGENIDLDDDGLFTRTLFGLSKTQKLYKETQKREDLEIYIVKDSFEKDKNSTASILKNYIEDKKGKTAIIFNSRQQLEYFTLNLSPHFKDSDIKIISQLTGSLGKITEQFMLAPENSIIFLTSRAWSNFEHTDLINNIIIQKIPFAPPSDPYIITASTNYEDPFNEFQIPNAIFALRTIINKLNRTPNIKKEAVILDSRIITKGYGTAFIESLKKIATTKIINPASLMT